MFEYPRTESLYTPISPLHVLSTSAVEACTWRRISFEEVYFVEDAPTLSSRFLFHIICKSEQRKGDGNFMTRGASHSSFSRTWCRRRGPLSNAIERPSKLPTISHVPRSESLFEFLNFTKDMRQRSDCLSAIWGLPAFFPHFRSFDSTRQKYRAKVNFRKRVEEVQWVWGAKNSETPTDEGK